jgi:hypothetical protein
MDNQQVSEKKTSLGTKSQGSRSDINYWKYAKKAFYVIGSLTIIGIIILLFQPFFQLLMKAFGFFDSLSIAAQSFFVGAPGKCVMRPPKLKCGDKKQYSGAECCTGIDVDGNKIGAGVGSCAGKNTDDEPNANMTCDHDDQQCCGCAAKGSKPCPSGKPIILNPLFIALSISLAFLAVFAYIFGKMYSGRTAKQSAATLDKALDLAKSSLDADLKKRVLEIEDRAKRETLTEEQHEKMTKIRESVDRAEIAREEAKTARETANKEDTPENKENAEEKEREAEAREAEARAEIERGFPRE